MSVSMRATITLVRVLRRIVRDSIVASISACHADDPGSIPGLGGLLIIITLSPDHIRRAKPLVPVRALSTRLVPFRWLSGHFASSGSRTRATCLEGRYRTNDAVLR